MNPAAFIEAARSIVSSAGLSSVVWVGVSYLMIGLNTVEHWFTPGVSEPTITTEME